MADEIAGWPSLEKGVDPIIGRAGSHQWLGHQAAHHDGQSTLAPGVGNRIPPSALPLLKKSPKPIPNQVHPAGAGLGASLEGGDGD